MLNEETIMKKRGIAGLFVLLAATVVLVALVAAHEGREVGNYVITFGWRIEPAYTDLLNGPEIAIEFHDTDEPVLDAVNNLTLKVSFGPDSKQLRLRDVVNEPGHYTADLIPTRPGDYTFH